MSASATCSPMIAAVAVCIGVAPCAAGCHSPPPECWGDCSLPGILIVGMRDDSGNFVEVHDGDAVDLTLPVQGGHVLFVAARVQNMEKRGVTLVGRLRDPVSLSVMAQDQRQIDFVDPAPNGFGQPDLADTSQVANITVCPDYLTRDVVAQDWILDVSVSDSRRVAVEVSHHVIPSCRQTDAAGLASCQCECLGCYFLGKCGGASALVGCDGG